ncbi:hypothetical protein MTR67_026240 [Solanum verrucosum]|uniref:Uncharacterized protein n=1 Tax=Solanum verrucosum TaxID=315347 RepID=A0AAF0R1X4_SOLVR|nr:hypothetical protein MTR67_026240 [Solanum verrucosum]
MFEIFTKVEFTSFLATDQSLLSRTLTNSMEYLPPPTSSRIKILKKYDKRTDALIHLAVIQKVLEEPFFKTDVLNKLVKECMTMLSSLLSQNEPSKAPEGEGSSGGGRSEGVTGGSSSRVGELAKTKNPSKAVPGGEGSSVRVTSVAEDLSEIQNPCNKTPGGERSSGVKDAEELVEMDNMGSMYLKVTKSALKVLQEMRSGSSTVSMFSLTPMHKVSKNVPVVGQATE